MKTQFEQKDLELENKETIRSIAIKRIQLRRRFHVELISSAVGMAFLIFIWATSEYSNAGGWPTQGFSQSSGIANVWNYWIIYPIIGWLIIVAARAWSIYGNKPISDSEIEREIKHLRSAH